MSSASENSAATQAEALLQVRDLHVSFDTEQGRVHAVRGVSFAVACGRTLGIVGESGCGKSVTLHTILGLTPENGARSGAVSFQGEDLLQDGGARLARVRGREIAMIFQEPLSALNPVHSIGSQIAEGLWLHRAMSTRQARSEALRLLERVGIPEPARRLDEYPHQLSGGMNQRAMIAMALACRPQLLLADEPTTALDVTIQAQILSLMQDLQREFGMAMVLVTHDLGVVAETADDVAVMYAGVMVEQATALRLFAHPLHPYTAGLLRALPRIDAETDSLQPIEGSLPSALGARVGCPFAPRCAHAQERCRRETPMLRDLGDGGARVACHFPLTEQGVAA